ncbi:MAG: hypothetical protein ACREXT_13990 [Gammaproteobacteria bacterium]
MLVEDDLLVDVRALVEHPLVWAVRLDEAAVKDGFSCRVDRFKFDPGFVKASDFGREGMRGVAVRDNDFNDKLFAVIWLTFFGPLTSWPFAIRKA